MSQLQTIFNKLSSHIYALAKELYPYSSGTQTYDTFSFASSTSSSALSGSGNVVINDNSVHYGYGWPSVTNVYTTCRHCSSKKTQCEDCKNKEKEKNDNNGDWYLGALLLGVLLPGLSYLVSKEYLKWRQLYKINKKASKLEKKLLEQPTDTVDVKLKQTGQYVPSKWSKWYNYYRGICRLYNLAKLGFVVSGLMMGVGLMQNPRNGAQSLRQLAYWTLVGSGCYTVTIMTFYHSLWKTKERNLMDNLVQECNTTYLSISPLQGPPASYT